MSNPTELLPGTSIAATSWYQDDKIQLRVYTQDINGHIRESRYSREAGWTGGTSKDIIKVDDVMIKARPNSPLAVISFGVDMMGFGVYYATRLYYISPDNILQELCNDAKPTWYAGDLDKSKFPASPVSRLAAIQSAVWNGGDASLFYQRPDGAIGNVYYSGPMPPGLPPQPVGWTDNGIVGRKPLFGTGLAAAPFNTQEKSYNSVFYQLPNGQLAQTNIDSDLKYSDGDLSKIVDAATATNISAWSPAIQPNSLRLCFLDKRNNPIELVYSDNQWSVPKRAGKFLPVPASDVSTIQVKDADNLRLYVQDENNVIQEYAWAKGYTEWVKASLIPVGDLQ